MPGYLSDRRQSNQRKYGRLRQRFGILVNGCHSLPIETTGRKHCGPGQFASVRPLNFFEEALTVRKLAGMIASTHRLDEFRVTLSEGIEPFDWLNRFYDLIAKAGLINFFDELRLLPDQQGHFKKRSELSRDEGIDEQLKKVGEKLGVEFRTQLLDFLRIVQLDIQKLLQPKTESEVLSKIIQELKRKSELRPMEQSIKDANVGLFSWILAHQKLDALEAFPVLTQSSNADRAVINLQRGTDTNRVPLAPAGCWPVEAQDFADIFPQQHVLSDLYFETTSDLGLWDATSTQGYFRLSPWYNTDEHLETFLPSEPLPDAEKQKHRTTVPVSVSTIAFLRSDEGILDAVRGSKTKAIKLLDFILTYLLDADPLAFQEVEAECDCGDKHRYFQAGWLVPLRKRRWIPIEKNRSAEPSADSLANLLANNEAVLSKLTEGRGMLLLKALGVGVADLLLRSVGADDDARASLTRDIATLLKAAGGDQGTVHALAEEASTDPTFLDEVKERKVKREKGKRNQAVGAEVERLLRSALESHDVKVKRTGIGSDFEVENDVVEGNEETVIEVSNQNQSYLIEVKATTQNSAKMTVTQGRVSVQQSDRFLLCMVCLNPGEEVDEKAVREGARLVTNIGDLIRPLYWEYEALNHIKQKVNRKSGDIEMEMVDSVPRFQIGKATWCSGLAFPEAIDFLKNKVTG